jgi:hypothetical protein
MRLFDLSEKTLRMPLIFFLLAGLSSLLVSVGDLSVLLLGMFSNFLIKLLLLAYVTSSLEGILRNYKVMG